MLNKVVELHPGSPLRRIASNWSDLIKKNDFSLFAAHLNVCPSVLGPGNVTFMIPPTMNWLISSVFNVMTQGQLMTNAFEISQSMRNLLTVKPHWNTGDLIDAVTPPNKKILSNLVRGGLDTMNVRELMLGGVLEALDKVAGLTPEAKRILDNIKAGVEEFERRRDSTPLYLEQLSNRLLETVAHRRDVYEELKGQSTMEGISNILCREHRNMFNPNEHNDYVSIIKQLYHHSILATQDYETVLRKAIKDVKTWNPHSDSRNEELGCHGVQVPLLTDENRILELQGQPDVPLTRTNVASVNQVQKIINDGLQRVVASAFGAKVHEQPVALSAVYSDKEAPDKFQTLIDLLKATRTHDKFQNVMEPIYSLSDLRREGLAHPNWLDSAAMVDTGKFLIKHPSPPIKWSDIANLSAPEQAAALMLYPDISSSPKCPPSVVAAVQQFESNLEKMKADLKVARESKSHDKQAHWSDLVPEDTPPADAHANVSVASPSRLAEVETAVTDLREKLIAIQAEKEAMEAKMKEEAEAVMQRRRDIDNKRLGVTAFLIDGGATSKEEAERAAAEKFPYP